VVVGGTVDEEVTVVETGSVVDDTSIASEVVDEL
jgi:hypothetical protein